MYRGNRIRTLATGCMNINKDLGKQSSWANHSRGHKTVASGWEDLFRWLMHCNRTCVSLTPNMHLNKTRLVCKNWLYSWGGFASPSCNLGELKMICREEQAKVGPQCCKRLITFYPRHLEAVIDSKGFEGIIVSFKFCTPVSFIFFFMYICSCFEYTPFIFIGTNSKDFTSVNLKWVYAPEIYKVTKAKIFPNLYLPWLKCNENRKKTANLLKTWQDTDS